MYNDYQDLIAEIHAANPDGAVQPHPQLRLTFTPRALRRLLSKGDDPESDDSDEDTDELVAAVSDLALEYLLGSPNEIIDSQALHSLRYWRHMEDHCPSATKRIESIQVLVQISHY